MAAVLATSGLGWREIGFPMMGAAIVVGTAVYALALAVLWLLAGQPAGAEADMLALARRGLRRSDAA